MKLVFFIFASILFLSSCKNKILDEAQQIELNKALEAYKSRNGFYPQNQNAFFFQEIIPFIEKRSLFKPNHKLLFLNVPNSGPSQNFQKIPIHILVDRNGRPLKYMEKAPGEFEFQLDTLPYFSDNHNFNKIDLISPKPGPYISDDSTEYHRALYNSNADRDRQIYFLKKGIPELLKVLEEYKNAHNTYPECCGKYFLNYLFFFMGDGLGQSLPHDYLLFDSKIKVPIYKTQDGPFPYPSYCYNHVNNSFSVYYTGKNAIDEMGLGDDALLH